MIRDATEHQAVHASRARVEAEMTPERLVELYADDVWRYASSKLRRREDAEDVTMETFAHAMKCWNRVAKADSPKLWLLAIARNKAHDALRKSYRRAESPLEERSEVPADVDPPHREELRQALADMPMLHREVLTLKYVSGLSIEEISRSIGRSATATNSLLQRARQSLRERAQQLIEAQGDM
jgi:RNA polymerase sigma-70 factor, ECF subfamily